MVQLSVLGWMKIREGPLRILAGACQVSRLLLAFIMGT